VHKRRLFRDVVKSLEREEKERGRSNQRQVTKARSIRELSGVYSDPF
jgi:hypothetical protein